MPDDAPNSKTSFLHIPATGEDKGCWIAAAKQRGQNLETWVTQTLNAAVPAELRADVRQKFSERPPKP